MLIADAVSMLSAVVLFILAIGSVKGFAFTLGLTTLIDVLVCFMFTKPLMTLLGPDQVLRRRPQVVRPRSGPPRGQGAARHAARARGGVQTARSAGARTGGSHRVGAEHG